ncbi:ATP-dependent dethiobiotin synthetase BioD [Sphingomonadales bacterium 56]|uniref:dethiobiotin synthase n=1 Tax=unclassified Sphingobium TaxID=2611147 RepID=UPI00191B6C14|nr:MULTISPECIES: dethiobiotin synthase [unclassified Sphingobium]MBY2929539.1 ATP-dependent dethiobiotin synthetase BioD [Sphingomonadales bacterium 56]MBY2958619.1 ATP-dependent dethiobiotin synthetase BioD [Sphingomonadales bacterium 58]CAD7337440.1 ATP-dependent dethiobiotin synthetase BioD 1 [Sphingobium sp. S8]CAD7339635.1 ATP-dependent dethiobiotin synthetase BioD 1 [Sphingobium sp. S6]
MTRFLVTGTDTDIGKTVFAAGLAGALGAYYWKPVQAGVDPEGDKETVARLGGIPKTHILPEAYRLRTPASPHLAARIDGVEVCLDKLTLPQVDGPLVVEGAGGVLVPVSETLLMADLFAYWQLPVILCARTALGTINHSLLSIEALRSRGVPLAGIAFIGDPHEENERIIPQLAKVPSLGRLPRLDPLNATSLKAAFAENIRLP